MMAFAGCLKYCVKYKERFMKRKMFENDHPIRKIDISYLLQLIRSEGNIALSVFIYLGMTYSLLGMLLPNSGIASRTISNHCGVLTLSRA